MKCFSTLSCIFPFSSLLLFYILHVCTILMYPVVLYEGTRMKTYLCKVQEAKLKAPLYLVTDRGTCISTMRCYICVDLVPQ